MNKKILGMILLAMLHVSPCFADQPRDIMQEAVKLLEAKKAQDAYKLLQKTHDENSTNPQDWFLLGMAAKESGDYEKAEHYLQKVEALDPKAIRVKLELAELAFFQGKVDETKRLLNEARSFNPPSQVSATIDRLMVNLGSVKDHNFKQNANNWRVWGSAGWLHDSNANAGPDTNTIRLFGLPYTLTPNAQETSDTALQYQFGLNHVVGITSTLGWQSDFFSVLRDYTHLNNLDTLYFSVGSGPSWRAGDNTFLSSPVVFDWVNVGHADAFYSYSVGLAPQIRHRLNSIVTLNSEVSVRERQFKTNSDRDTTEWAFNPSIDINIDPKTNIRLRAGAFDEDSGISFFSNRGWDFQTQFFHTFNEDFLLNLNLGYEQAWYEGTEPAYTEKRNDRILSAGVSLIYNIDALDIDAIASVQHIDQNSNLRLYDYDRDIVSLSVRKAVTF